MPDNCDFCDATLTTTEPANVALLAHLGRNPACEEQFGFMVDNLRASWTATMSGP